MTVGPQSCRTLNHETIKQGLASGLQATHNAEEEIIKTLSPPYSEGKVRVPRGTYMKYITTNTVLVTWPSGSNRRK